MKIPSATQLLTTRAEIQEQEQILDALQAVISASLPTSEKVFECSLTKVPASTAFGRSKFRKIRKLFESTKNPYHQAYNYHIRRVYQVDMPTQNAAYDKKACAIGNVKPHWHGTSTANLLSILKGGLIIPTRLLQRSNVWTRHLWFRMLDESAQLFGGKLGGKKMRA